MVFKPSKSQFGRIGDSTIIEFPVYISWPKSLFLEDFLRIRQGTKFLISENSSVTIKKFTVIGVNNMIIPNKHISTVGIPQFILGASGINDVHNHIVIEEDVWTGSNVTLIGNASLGRGCVCGACSVVTKPVPPYAVVAGSPARIVAVKFSIDQIIEHEKILYQEKDRFCIEYLNELFETHYKNVRVFGVSTAFTENQIDKLRKCAEARGYYNEDFYERLSHV